MDTASVIANNLPNTDVDTLQQKSALGNIQARQAQGAQSAFAGIDFSDPTSISNGITNLIKSNNVPAASALAGFAFQQQARQSPVAQAWLNGTPVPGAAAPSASNAAPAATSPPGIATPTGAPDYNEHISSEALPPAEPNAQAIAAHSSETLNQVSSAIGNIKTLPVEERPAAIASLKDQLIQRGVPAEAVDQEANYILSTPDKAGQDARLDEIAAHIGAHADLHGAVAQGQMPTEAQQAAVAASPQSPSVGSGQPWYVGTVNSPGYAATSAASPVLKIAGIDVSPYLQTARELAAPYISKAAEAANARQIASETSQGKLPADIALEQIKQHFEAGYKNVTIYPPGDTEHPVTITQAEFSENPEKYKGYSTEPGVAQKAVAEAAGSKEGATPYETKTIQIDGKPTEVSVRKDANGNTIYTPVTLGTDGKAAQGASEADIADQKNLVENINKIPTEQLALQESSKRGKRIIAQANQITTGKYTPSISELAQIAAPILGPKANLTKYANNAELLKQDLSGSFKEQLGGIAVPRISSEANAILNAMPKNTSPQDLIKVYGGILTAASNYKQNYNNHLVQFKSNSANEPTQTNAQNAWNTSPNNHSLYSDPVWNGVTVGGQPAVQHVTKNGHNALVVFKGLLGKNAIVERLD